MEITTEQKFELKQEVQKEIYRRDFFTFVQFAAEILEPQTKWSWNFHHKYICDTLQKETLRIKAGQPRDKHLIINVPFRSSKSLICSILFPVWSWLVSPQMSFINLSYSDNLSTDHSNKVMALINHPEFQKLFKWEFDDQQRSKTDFKLKTGGQRLSGGLTGTVLGRGSDIIVMDDPNNTRRLSTIERHNTIKAWSDTISTRLNNPREGLFIVIQQRLHAEDLSGYLLEKEPGNWNEIVLPAELKGNVMPPELSEQYVDDLLWPDRFSREVLDNFHTSLGSVQYAGQLNQLTSPEQGNIILRDWIQIESIDKFREKCEINNVKPKWDIYVDSAQTEKKKNDPTGILIACKLFNNVYVKKVYEKRLTFPDLVQLLRNLYEDNRANRILIEPKSSGKDIVAQLKRQTTMNVVELPSPTTDKETRLNAVSPLIEAGRLVLLEDITNNLVVDQLLQFPNHSHDEFVDLVGYALTKYVKSINLNYLMI